MFFKRFRNDSCFLNSQVSSPETIHVFKRSLKKMDKILKLHITERTLILKNEDFYS